VTQFLDCFFGKLPQFHTSNFRKVVWQHTEGVVGSPPWVWCTTFLGHSIYQNCIMQFK